jgi:hypothetical protein
MIFNIRFLPHANFYRLKIVKFDLRITMLKKNKLRKKKQIFFCVVGCFSFIKFVIIALLLNT